MTTPAASNDKKAEKRTYWAHHITQWKDSGETQRQYCRHQQLVYHQFTYWKKRLHQPKANRSSDTGGFIAVPLKNKSTPRTQNLILQLPNGCRIEGISTDNLPIIRDILRWHS